LADDFDRARFTTRLRTQRLGRTLRVLEHTVSTNDDAWDALAGAGVRAGGRGDGAAVVALAQTGGRGRAGRAWSQVPGRGLALSVALRLDGDAREAGVIPLVAGLAVVRTAHALGVAGARLKWPNDVVVSGRKLAGVLCEMRRSGAAANAASGAERAAEPGAAVVIGVGLNVRHRRDEFPGELRDTATSLALEGATAGVEDAAAECLSQLEPLWAEFQAGERAALLAEWSRWCGHWGEWLVARTPAGPVEGSAQRLDGGGGLVLRTASGVETTVLAGDVSPSAAGCDAP
jgi:BirA family biotin operon repressor/biotin-[acetyl-CoA-carboxylase] ligase